MPRSFAVSALGPEEVAGIIFTAADTLMHTQAHVSVSVVLFEY